MKAKTGNSTTPGFVPSSHHSCYCISTILTCLHPRKQSLKCICVQWNASAVAGAELAEQSVLLTMQYRASVIQPLDKCAQFVLVRYKQQMQLRDNRELSYQRQRGMGISPPPPSN